MFSADLYQCAWCQSLSRKLVTTVHNVCALRGVTTRKRCGPCLNERRWLGHVPGKEPSLAVFSNPVSACGCGLGGQETWYLNVVAVRSGPGTARTLGSGCGGRARYFEGSRLSSAWQAKHLNRVMHGCDCILASYVPKHATVWGNGTWDTEADRHPSRPQSSIV